MDTLGLNPTDVPKPGVDIGKAKGVYGKVNDVLSWEDNVEAGRNVKIEQDTLMCKAEKEMDDRIAANQITPEAAKQALVTKKAAIYMDGVGSKIFEELFSRNAVGAAAKFYGYETAPENDCYSLLGTTPPPRIYNF